MSFVGRVIRFQPTQLKQQEHYPRAPRILHELWDMKILLGAGCMQVKKADVAHDELSETSGLCELTSKWVGLSQNLKLQRFGNTSVSNSQALAD